MTTHTNSPVLPTPDLFIDADVYRADLTRMIEMHTAELARAMFDAVEKGAAQKVVRVLRALGHLTPKVPATFARLELDNPCEGVGVAVIFMDCGRIDITTYKRRNEGGVGMGLVAHTTTDGKDIRHGGPPSRPVPDELLEIAYALADAIGFRLQYSHAARPTPEELRKELGLDDATYEGGRTEARIQRLADLLHELACRENVHDDEEGPGPCTVMASEFFAKEAAW